MEDSQKQRKRGFRNPSREGRSLTIVVHKRLGLYSPNVRIIPPDPGGYLPGIDPKSWESGRWLVAGSAGQKLRALMDCHSSSAWPTGSCVPAP